VQAHAAAGDGTLGEELVSKSPDRGDTESLRRPCRAHINPHLAQGFGRFAALTLGCFAPPALDIPI
jgi:hypothetical protein